MSWASILKLSNLRNDKRFNFDQRVCTLNSGSIKPRRDSKKRPHRDAVVYFPKANVVHTGDIYFSGTYPFIDMSSGGSIDGIIAAVNRVLSMIDDETKIIPGHGPLSNKKEMQTYLGVLTSIRDRISEHISAGKFIGRRSSRQTHTRI